MGYRCRWQVIGRNDYVGPKSLTPEQVKAISSVDLVQIGKLSFNVFENDQLLGRVRTTIGGQKYRPLGCEVWLSAADDWHSNEPKNGRGILCLLEYQTESIGA